MSEIIRIGFIGAGANTRLRHLPGFKEIEGVALATVANRTEESSRKVAEEFGIERVSADWRAVVDDPDIDAICIGTWPYMHAEITVAALKAGKHVLTEARMAASLPEAKAMYAAALAHPELVAQIVPSPFTLDVDNTIKQLLDAESIGKVLEVFIDHSHAAYADPVSPMTWRQDRHYSGVNMLTMGIYHEIIQRWFADAFKVDHVSSGIVHNERAHWETGESSEILLPDFVHVLGRLKRGAVLNYHFSGIERGPGRNEIKLVGSEGTLRLDVGGNKLYLCGPDGEEEPIVIPDAERRGWRVEADFIESIRTDKAVKLTSFEEGLRYMEFTDAVYKRLS